MPVIKTRQQAAMVGENKYWTGRKCNNGHSSPRYTSSGICCQCNYQNGRKYAKIIKENMLDSEIAIKVTTRPEHIGAIREYAKILNGSE